MSNPLDRHTFEAAYAGGEALVPIAQRESVFHLEFHGQATLGRLAASHANGFIDEIDAGDPMSAGRQKKRVLARSAARIKNRAGYQLDRFSDGCLRLADIPVACSTFCRMRTACGTSPGLPMSPSQADGYCCYVSATSSPAHRVPGASRSGRFGPLLTVLGRLKRSGPGARMCARTWKIFHSPQVCRRSGARSLAGTGKAELARNFVVSFWRCFDGVSLHPY